MKTSFVACLLAALLLSSFLLLPSSSAQTASPTLIPFQGQLTGQAGVAYTAGQYTIVFNLYNRAVGGPSIWTERHQKVGVINGMVNVFLGSIQTIGAVDFSQVKYLGITIDADDNATTADPEMVPRQMIIPAFAAKTAEKIVAFNPAGQSLGQSYGWTTLFDNGDPSSGKISGAKLSNSSVNTAQLTDGAVTSAKFSPGAIGYAALAQNVVKSDIIEDGTILRSDLNSSVQQSLVPVGTIIAYAGSAPPPGWLLCDGSALRSANPQYSSLFAVIQTSWGNGTSNPVGPTFPAILSGPDQTDFNVPDARGYFLRGVSGAGPTDPDRATRGLAAPGGNSANNVGSVQVDGFKSHNHLFSNSTWRAVVYGGGAGIGGVDLGVPGTGTFIATPESIGFAGGNETRPKNIYVNYIIKY